ncbi:ATP-binding protein [Candidatus Parvarchaeota archaeon]|nr:ATP-binding protein [Candidatus Parvarchaeota archaeon]
MKIGIAGGQGIGKTTLAIQLSRYLNISLIPDIAKEMATINKYDLTNINEKEFINFQEKAIKSKILTEKHHKAFISDTTILDYLSVTTLYSKNISKDHFVHLMQLVKKASYNYDVIIVIPSGQFELVNDGVRSINYIHQWKRYVMLIGWVTLWKLRWFLLHKQDVDKRLQEILNYLNKEANRWLS